MDISRDWIKKANCREMDTDLFFPERGASAKEAMEICAACKVAEPCLAMALIDKLHVGIYGGMSERQRRRMPKEQKQQILDKHSPYRCTQCNAGLQAPISKARTPVLLCNTCSLKRAEQARERLLRRSA